MSRLVPSSKVTAIGEAAVARRVRGDVEHVLDAVDLLLERRDDGGGHHVGAGAGILARDVDDRRRDLGILGDRQAPEGDERPGSRTRSTRPPAKIGRSMKKREMRMAAAAPQLAVAWEPPANAEAAMPATCLRRHLDAGTRPHQAVDDDAVVGLEARGDDAQAIDDRTRASRISAARRSRRRPRARTCAPARCRWRRPARAAPPLAAAAGHLDAREHAGREACRSGLANSARPRMVPEPRSMALSTKSILPSWRNFGSSMSLSSTGTVDAAVGRVARCRRRGACSAGRTPHPW